MYLRAVKDKLDLFLNRNKADQTALLFSVYLFTYFIYSGIQEHFFINIIPILIFVIIVLAFREQIFTARFWMLTTFLLALGIVEHWHDPANHEYVITYISLLMVLVYSQSKDKHDSFLQAQAKYIFALVMFLAGLQKLLSPQYVDGSLLEFMFLTGRFAPHITNNELTLAGEIAANNVILEEFGHNFLNGRTVRFEWYSPAFHSIAKPLAWIIISSEIVIGALALWFFNRVTFQVLVIAFVIGVFLIRPEGGFLAVLLILAWSQLPNKYKSIHTVYMSCLLLILALVITRISLG